MESPFPPVERVQLTPAQREAMIAGLIGRVLRWMETAGESGPRNAWITVPGFKAYVRKSQRKFGGQYLNPVLDIANIELDQRYWGQGIGPEWMERMHQANPWMATHLESTINDRLLGQLRANPEWTEVPGSMPPGFYRMTGHMSQEMDESADSQDTDDILDRLDAISDAVTGDLRAAGLDDISVSADTGSPSFMGPGFSAYAPGARLAFIFDAGDTAGLEVEYDDTSWWQGGQLDLPKDDEEIVRWIKEQIKAYVADGGPEEALRAKKRRERAMSRNPVKRWWGRMFPEGGLPRSFGEYAAMLTEDDWIDRTQDRAAPGYELSQVRDVPAKTASALHLKIGHLIGQIENTGASKMFGKARVARELAQGIQAQVDTGNFTAAAAWVDDAMNRGGPFGHGLLGAPRMIMQELSRLLRRADEEQAAAHGVADKLPASQLGGGGAAGARWLGTPREPVPSRLAPHAFKPKAPDVNVTQEPEARKVVSDLAAAARIPVRFVDATLQAILAGGAAGFVATSPILILTALATDTGSLVTGGLSDLFGKAVDSLKASWADAKAAGQRVTPEAFATKAAGPLSWLLKKVGLFDSKLSFVELMGLAERRMFKTGRELPKLSPATLARRLRVVMDKHSLPRRDKGSLNAIANALEDEPDETDLRAIIQAAQRLRGAAKLPPKVRAVLTLIADQTAMKGAPAVPSVEAADAFQQKYQVWADRWVDRISKHEKIEAADYDQLLDGISSMIVELNTGQMLDPKLMSRIRLWAGDAIHQAELGRSQIAQLVMQVPRYLMVAATGNAIQSRKAIGWLNKLEDWS